MKLRSHDEFVEWFKIVIIPSMMQRIRRRGLPFVYEIHQCGLPPCFREAPRPELCSTSFIQWCNGIVSLLGHSWKYRVDDVECRREARLLGVAQKCAVFERTQHI